MASSILAYALSLQPLRASYLRFYDEQNTEMKPKLPSDCTHTVLPLNSRSVISRLMPIASRRSLVVASEEFVAASL